MPSSPPSSRRFTDSNDDGFRKSMHQDQEKVSSEGSSSTPSIDADVIRAIRRRRSISCGWWLGFSLIHLVILAIYIFTIVSLKREVQKLRVHGPRLVPTPGNEAVEWEVHTFDHNDMIHGPFTGDPRPEIDKNWHDLVNAENIVIEPEYMAHYGRDQFGVAVPDGAGYIGTLNVYHELHCLKRIYQYTYPEVYGKSETHQERENSRRHKDHCIDFLRQASMCHGDVGIMTFQWSPNSLIPVANSTAHQCANWKKIDQWTKARTVDMMKPGWLIHPTKGQAYPVGAAHH